MTDLRMQLTLQPSAAELLGLLSAVPDIARREFTRAGWQSSLLLQREVQENTPTGIGAGGGLKGSIIAIEPVVSTERIESGAATSLVYAVPVELGSRPHRPPVEPLQDWARMKLGLPADQARAAGFRIAGAIARRGTKGAFMFKRAYEAQGKQVVRIYEKAADRIRQQMGRRQ